ncbi:MAG TPA: zinc ribbon domain-containing protein [Anaerolineaceae bacterium]|nr:zinc ribbon domain-containing protein [Anaerolineaceae bacterium]HPN52116.1 zinc ribbon domain-containing protein [Anaerolineaceae bacterium]
MSDSPHTLTCPSCGADNPAGMSFCAACGAPLIFPSAAPEPPPAAPRPAHIPTAEETARKQRQEVITAMIIEIAAGIFGFLGIGWIFAGKTGQGVILLISGCAAILFGAVVGLITGGIGFVCFCLYPIFPVLSGIWLKSVMEKDRGL